MKKNKYREEQIGEGPFQLTIRQDTTCRCEPVYQI